jgi:hypothetical protein
MTAKRITILLVAFCAFTGAAVGGVASMPVAAPDIAAAGGSAATAAPAAATGGSVAAANGSTEHVSDCDVVDVDGNNNTVSVNLTSNATAGEGSGVSVRIRCGVGTATTVDHDLIDIDGNNNTVRLVVQAENGTLAIGQGATASNDTGPSVALNPTFGTLYDPSNSSKKLRRLLQ